MAKAANVLIDCERMKYPYTGLYYYCLHLGKALLNRTDKERLCFYVPPSAQYIFGDDVFYIKQHSLHKFSLPSTKSYAVWHCTYQGTNYFPWRPNIKVLFTIHDLNFMYDASKSEAKKKKYLEKLKAKVYRADHIVAISQFTLNDLKKHIDIAHKPCSVIYNGCTIDEIADLQPPKYIPVSPFFFTIGTIVEKKNFHVLPSLLLKNDFQLLIAGITQDERYKGMIISEAKKLGVADRVVFTGSIDENDKQWYLKHCAAFAFPSISEGFGLPVVEAMHFGKPVLLSACTSLPEIGGKEAYYFQSFDPEHMAGVAAMALSEYSDYKAEKIKRWAENFNWETAAQQYLQLYSALASS